MSHWATHCSLEINDCYRYFKNHLSTILTINIQYYIALLQLPNGRLKLSCQWLIFGDWFQIDIFIVNDYVQMPFALQYLWVPQPKSRIIRKHDKSDCSSQKDPKATRASVRCYGNLAQELMSSSLFFSHSFQSTLFPYEWPSSHR